MVDALVVLFSPFVACVAICFFALKRPKLASGLALAGIFVSLAASAWMFWFHLHTTLGPAEFGVPWIEAAGIRVEFGYLLDPLSLLMLLVVTGVSSCVFLYSVSYMEGDSSTPRYFASLSLFAFSMLGIVLANNFFMLFVFWELVAVSSYLLIGFWFEKPSAAAAAQKAFVVNRLADFGMVLGIFSVWMLSGSGGGGRTFQFSELERRIPELLGSGAILPAALTVAALLVFCGVIGKSAQFPLYIWLPDAMEGPTPVSALIHAATMVAAGVYMLSRAFFLVSGLENVLSVIATLGAVTAVLAAGLAVAQNDIKKILAYSTVSQLGYMVLALGLGSRDVAMFHLTTHAFFKALLFLGAGSMIHALHTQDIWEMGGLKKDMPVTTWTFLIGTLALCGVPPLSGFFSKDEILALAFEKNKLLWIAALATAGLTAFYMSRALAVAVFGKRRKKAHVHEAPFPMKAPLVVLAVLAAVAGFIGIPEFLARLPAVAGGSHAAHEGPHGLNWTVAITSTLVALAGLAAGWAVYSRAGETDPLVSRLGAAYRVLANKYYLDDAFSAMASFFDRVLAGFLFRFDVGVVIERGVNGVARATSAASDVLRRVQTGALRSYAALFAAGVVAMAYWAIVRS